MKMMISFLFNLIQVLRQAPQTIAIIKMILDVVGSQQVQKLLETIRQALQDEISPKSPLPSTEKERAGIVRRIIRRLQRNDKVENFSQTIPFSLRQSLAEPFVVAAEKLETGGERLLMEEELRKALAGELMSADERHKLDEIVQRAVSADTKIYAENLRSIAQELKK